MKSQIARFEIGRVEHITTAPENKVGLSWCFVNARCTWIVSIFLRYIQCCLRFLFYRHTLGGLQGILKASCLLRVLPSLFATGFGFTTIIMLIAHLATAGMLHHVHRCQPNACYVLCVLTPRSDRSLDLDGDDAELNTVCVSYLIDTHCGS